MTYVLDASALLRLVLDQPGAERVGQILDSGFFETDQIFISAVNWGEVITHVDRVQGRDAALKLAATLIRFKIKIISADASRAEQAALLKRDWSIGYADAFCAQLAIELHPATLVTADFDFKPLQQLIQIEFLPTQPTP